MNPFALPERDLDDVRPLCPWECADHGAYYAAVDHTQASYEKFQETIVANPAQVTSGRVILVSGGEGCGKTALINRCASWLQHWLHEKRSIELIILDLTREGLPGIATLGRIGNICDRVIDELELGTIFQEDELKALEKRRQDPTRAYPTLGRLLRNNSRAIAVLLPPIEVAHELSSYRSLVNEHIFFFCETSYDQVAEYSRSMFITTSNAAITNLSVGVLGVEDGWVFVKSRIHEPPVSGEELPTLSEDTIRHLMEVRISGRGRTTVRELHLACLNVFDRALSKQASIIDYADFADYYTMKASLI